MRSTLATNRFVWFRVNSRIAPEAERIQRTRSAFFVSFRVISWIIFNLETDGSTNSHETTRKNLNPNCQALRTVLLTDQTYCDTRLT